jgi:hypothetical protein
LLLCSSVLFPSSGQYWFSNFFWRTHQIFFIWIQISALEEKMKEENEELQTHLLEIESLKVDDLNSHHSCFMTNALCGLFF